MFVKKETKVNKAAVGLAGAALIAGTAAALALSKKENRDKLVKLAKNASKKFEEKQSNGKRELKEKVEKELK